MLFSSRISNVQPSPTVALNSKAKKLAQQGSRVFNFAVGEPDMDTPQVVIQAAISALESGRTKYGPPGGGQELLQTISQKLKDDNNLHFSPQEIVCGIGAKEILFHLSLALLNDGDEVIIPAPYWVSYTDHAIACGAKPIVIPFNMQTLKLDFAAIEKALSPKTKIFLLNSPNNPGGYVLSKEELRQLGNILRQSNCWIISDEIYEYMTYEKTHLSLLEVCPDLKERFILVNGMSKGFAMTGWRVGYCAAPPKVAEMVRTLQSQSSTCLPGFIEDASVAALANREHIRKDLLAAMIEKKNFVLDLLAEIQDIRWIPCDGAFYCFIDISSYLQTNTSITTSMAFGEYLLDKFHVAMVPGEAFGTPGFVRLSYATSITELASGIEKFKDALYSLKEKSL